MIAEIIKTLQSNEFYGAGKYTEIAKGSLGRDVAKPKAPTYNPSDKSYTFTK
jgi:hypothetical protein